MEAMIKKILAENERRNARLSRRHNPETGEGCVGQRKRVAVRGHYYYLPQSWVEEPEFAALLENMNKEHEGKLTNSLAKMKFEKNRCRHDFEFWAWRCAKIKDKISGKTIAFTLNQPQQKLLKEMEEQRMNNEPIRIILLKARQWGGSTLVQLYFAWIQLVKAPGKNLLICAHVKNSASVIREMYSQLLREYPPGLWEGGKKSNAVRDKGFKALKGAPDTQIVPGRNATVTIGSSFAQDTVRGLDISLAHLSETAYWMDSQKMSPESFIRAVCSGIPLSPLTGIVMESTANGTGNYFHSEWLRAKNGESDKRAVFIPWYEIEIYRKPVMNAEALWRNMDSYEKSLWERGLTLEMIQWYHDKRKEAADHGTMMTEFPTDDTEAFVHTGLGVFSPESVNRLMCDCREPQEIGELSGEALTGELCLKELRFTKDSAGGLKIWNFPAPGAGNYDRYVVAVDVGGRTTVADWSVITVIDRGSMDGSSGMQISAQWRGHIDHDLLGWKAAQIAKWYGDALLVIESNTLEHESVGSSSYILEELSHYYPRLYSRTVYDEVTLRRERKYGFHTNRATKATIISSLISMVREHGYEERDLEACHELMTYRQLPSGSYCARQGCHDDILMTRAIGLYVALSVPRRVEGNCGVIKQGSKW